MKNFLLASLLVLLGALSANAQTGFMHGAGLNYLLVIDNGNVLGNYGFEYSPRYNMIGSEKFSLSVGTHLGLSGSLSLNSQSGGSFSYFVMLPALLGVNFGAYSTSENISGVGGYLEGGYALALSGLAGLTATLHGPIVGIGMRFDTIILNEIGFYYLKPVNAAGVNSVGIRVARIF